MSEGPRRQKPLLIAVAGASGSGKSTLAEELARELEGTHLHLDHYYRDLNHMPPEERARQNFDHPDTIEFPLLLSQLKDLLAGQAVERPVYDFSCHTRLADRTETLREPRVLVLDGIFALHWPELRALADLSVYVDTPDELCFARRLRRDVEERGRSPEGVTAHYNATVRPMAEHFVRPTARWADVVADGSSSLDWSIEQVLSALDTRRLLPQEDLTEGADEP